ncbi:glycosyltransferase family 2 protein [Butyrivibrio proteoclasticus]|uniref:glycosyltransferase family 2 protein n=1 Tax=Butyrivibrio proteoclasticus TaxID=43305 RepID=UPI000478B956|nr:glycosyltransferase [Butyrivibrio proteoclasticus]
MPYIFEKKWDKRMVYVITAVHNRRAITSRFIDYLALQDCSEEIHLVMVDDGSTDGTDLLVKEKYKNSTILYGDGNLFWGGALQKAYSYLISKNISDDDVILYANDDSRLESTFVETLISDLKNNPNDLVTGCAYGLNTGNYLDGPVDFNLENGAVKHLEPGSIGNCASTRALGMYGKVFKDIGGFHPILLPHYASDYEYTIRAFKKGHRIVSDSNLKYLFSEDTTGDNSHSNLSLKKILSKRSKLNPFYKMSFFLMIAPFYKMPKFINYQFRHFKKHERDIGKAV